MISLLIGMLAALIFFCLLMVVLNRKNLEENNINNRMAYFSGVEASLRHTRAGDSRRRSNKTLKERLYYAVKSLGARLEKIKKSSNLDRKMQQAGWPLLGSEFQVVLLGCGVLGAIVLGLLTMTPLNAVLGFAAGGLVCLMVLSVSIQRRQKANEFFGSEHNKSLFNAAFCNVSADFAVNLNADHHADSSER